ncbi:MAG: tetratricopeptide repeat protein [Pseudodesulfovibrio sp.]
MPSIKKLIDQLPEISQSRLVASGFGVWVAWKGDLNKAVRSTLTEYGALIVAEESDQALWFCSSTEIFRALARLQIWARVNPIPAFCEVIPLTFLVGYEMEHSVSLSSELDRQDARIPSDFEVVVHPKLKDQVNGVIGLATEGLGNVEGLAPVDWLGLQVDQGLDYETNKKWFFLVKPLGKMSDKESIVVWREYSTEIIELLRNNGLKYVSDIDQGVIYFPLDSFQLLRSFCSEIMTLIKSIKDDPERKTWPVVMVAVPQENLSFSPDLPKKVGLDWNRLTPDFPHVSFMDGFLLSEWFRMDEVRYGTDAVSLASWCTITLKDGGRDVGPSTMQVAMANVLVGMDGEECFYCGQTNHEPKDCPTRKLEAPSLQVWQTLAKTDIKEFSKGFIGLDEIVTNADFAESMLELINSDKILEGLMAKAVLEVNASAQLRMLKLIWRCRGKIWSDGFKELAPQEKNLMWDALFEIENGEMEKADDQIKQAQLQFPRSFQPHSLMGFWNLETGKPAQALFHWQEAERMSYTPVQQGYFAFLQGRVLEIEGSLKDAINTYKHANTYSPTWIDPVYRQGVCMVKMGFTGQAMDLFTDLINRDPHVFNKILIDPELDRGRMQLMSSLWESWAEAENNVKDAREQVDTLIDDIAKRFDENHSYFESANVELERLKKIGEINNYVAYNLLLTGTERFGLNLDNKVKREVKRIDANLEYQADRVREVQKEAAWFPFPKLLLEFNRDFNFCVDKINWIKTQNLKDPDLFRQALSSLEEIEDHIDSLQSRLVTLRIVRDSTLFVLMLGRSFIWFELIGLGLALVSMPALIYFTKEMPPNWILDTLREQRWEVTKGLVIILSIICLALAAIKSAISFDKRKRELFEQLDEEMRKSAPKRY